MSIQADEEEQLPAPAAATAPPQVLSYRRAGDRQTFVTLRRMPAVEAQMAAAKLDAEGITAFVAGQHLAGAHPVLFTEVQLQVLHEDLARAAQVLDQPAVRAPARDDDDDYAEEEYRCPRCHRKEVDLVALTPGRRILRRTYITLLLAPPLLGLLSQMTHDDEWLSLFKPLTLPWIIAVAVLTYVVVSGRRVKRCRTCAAEW